MEYKTDALASLKAFRRPEAQPESEVVTASMDRVMQAIAAELRSVLVDIDECNVSGESISGAVTSAHTLVNVLDRMGGLDPNRLLDE